ncbi:hypothetical protein KGQ71_03120 [Patescibacteria group bacterium]|nr:hypothetical protein [Patescibacteria group bacterium]
MYTVRFNPLFHQWVLVGPPLAGEQRQLRAGQLTQEKKGSDFLVAAIPNQPFVLDPADRPIPGNEKRLFREQPAVGEYELMLYQGKTPFFEWGKREWAGWLTLLHQRIRQFHYNPHLHYLTAIFQTVDLRSVDGYQRVGDLLATEYPLGERLPGVPAGLVEKLREGESEFFLHRGERGGLYVPSAALLPQEVWYLPESETVGIEEISPEERADTAAALSALFGALHAAYPKEQYRMTVCTQMADVEARASWWIRIHADREDAGQTVSIQSRPELFLRRLRQFFHL